MWLKQCHLHHPPVITIFIGARNHSQSWVIDAIVLTTFIGLTAFFFYHIESPPLALRYQEIQQLLRRLSNGLSSLAL